MLTFTEQPTYYSHLPCRSFREST